MTTGTGREAIRTQLVWNRLLAIVEEQARTLMRTAFSTVVREAGDLSAGVFDTRGAMLAQAVTGTPGHVNAMAESVGKFLAKHPLDTLVPGDVLLTNDPWDATGHLNDFTVVTPVFADARPVALFASTSHIADVGGRGFGPEAHEVFEEGIAIPIGHLFRAGELNATLMEIVRANVRDPLVAEGDLYSLTACNATGAEQLLAMLADFGLDGLDDVGASIVATSRRAMAEEIAALPNGTWRYAMDVDGYDTPVRLACALTIEDARILVDFDGTSGLSRFGINVPLNYTRAYASFGVRCVVGGDVPNNAGSLELVDVTAPEGCILNAPRPAAVSARHALGQMLPDVILGCLAQVIPGPRPGGGRLLHLEPGAALEFARRRRRKRPRNAVRHQPHLQRRHRRAARARTASRRRRSRPACGSTPTEINEVTAPLVVWRKEYLADSGGPGRLRGGLGQVIEIAHGEGAPFEVSRMFDRIRHPARGRGGGQAGRPGAVYLMDGDERAELPPKGKETVPAGATLVMETPGGGGIGDPRERAREALADDVEAGVVSPEAAERTYGAGRSLDGGG